MVLSGVSFTVRAAVDERTINTITTSPCNSFDNQAGGSVDVSLDLSGGGAGAENPDNQGGYRLEYYNASGDLVRRSASLEVNANPTAAVTWDGTDDSGNVLPYGSYTVRAYVSMKDPTITAQIKGSGITIDRPGDVYVTASGILSWTNGGGRLSFCQVSLGDPNTDPPTFLRLVDLPFGTNRSDNQYGIVMNSNNEVFVVDNTGKSATAIAKYDISTETWTNLNWATPGGLGMNVAEWYGLGIDGWDSIYVACRDGN
ncbi:MAG: hypothetical protein D6679_12510, partial [Candidatus Hydrogenedentota bacterium]